MAAQLIYSAICSLDGYVADASGDFGWAAPDEEVHAFVNDRERSLGTNLYGRRMYETMRVWETWDTRDEPPVIQDYAEIWRAADKIVFSSTLESVGTERTRLERHFDPDAIRALKRTAERDISIGGPGLAAHAVRTGLVDELHLFVCPTLVGGGNPALPDGVRADLTLLGKHRFGNGVVNLRYRMG
jgi:dihydrofolate reductase